jgi:hypothetical protein
MKTKFEDIKPNDGKLHGIYRGVIEDRVDLLKLGRCKIRVFGVHTPVIIKDQKHGIPTKELPWAEPAMGLIEGSVSGFGLWSVPLQGSHVFVFFENGNLMQPRYFASAPGIPESAANGAEAFNDPNGEYPRSDRINESDVHRLARNEDIDQTIVEQRNTHLDKATTSKGETWDEPPSAYAAEYPDNIVLATHVGITVELDTTAGAERVHVYHPSGSYIEIDKDGNMVVRNAKDRFDIVDANEKKHIVENYDRSVDVDRTSNVGANETEKIGGNRKTTIAGNDDLMVGGTRTVRASVIYLN